MKDIVFKTIMLKGESGDTIASIEKTSSALNIDTYTITLSDGTTQTFEVTNGSSIQSIEKTATSGYTDTYTITLTNGETATFQVTNGEDAALYEVPTNSVIGYDAAGNLPEGYESLGSLEDYIGLMIADLVITREETVQLSVTGSNQFEKLINSKTLTPPTGYKFLGIGGISADNTFGANILSPAAYYANLKLNVYGYAMEDDLTGTANIYVEVFYIKDIFGGN